jgi:putrescine:ornithine antiporter
MQRKRLFEVYGYRSVIAIFTFVLLAPLALKIHAAKTETPVEALARIRQTGTFRIGYYADAGPFSYQDEKGQPAGYAVALCQEIANDLKSELGLSSLNVEFVLVTGEDRFDAVKQRRVDLLCGPSVETIARRKQVSFSIPIFLAGLGALLRSDAPAQVRDVLSGHEPPYRPLWRGSIGLALQHRTFSAVTGTTSLTWLNSKIGEFQIDAKVVPVNSHDAGVQRVLNRSSDVLFGERSILLDAKKRNPAGKDLIVLDRLFTLEPLGLAVAREDEDLRLLVDQSLSKLSRSGHTQAVYKQFFGEPDENTLAFFRMNRIVE